VESQIELLTGTLPAHLTRYGSPDMQLFDPASVMNCSVRLDREYQRQDDTQPGEAAHGMVASP